jgi:hypothetical protein
MILSLEYINSGSLATSAAHYMVISLKSADLHRFTIYSLSAQASTLWCLYNVWIKFIVFSSSNYTIISTLQTILPALFTVVFYQMRKILEKLKTKNIIVKNDKIGKWVTNNCIKC